MVTYEPYSRARLFATYAGPLKIKNITEKNVTDYWVGVISTPAIDHKIRSIRKVRKH